VTELWLTELSALKRDLGPLRPMLLRWRVLANQGMSPGMAGGTRALAELIEPELFEDTVDAVEAELYPLGVAPGDRPALIVPLPRTAPLGPFEQGIRVQVAGPAAAPHAAALVLPDGQVVFCAGAARRPSFVDRARWPGGGGWLRRRSRAEGAGPPGGSHPS
jgi:glyoxylase-like metal-dependent hydrolase (beta-lactamase superfamily II)